MNISYFYGRKLREIIIFEHIYFLYLAGKLSLFYFSGIFLIFVSFLVKFFGNQTF